MATIPWGVCQDVTLHVGPSRPPAGGTGVVAQPPGSGPRPPNSSLMTRHGFEKSSVHTRAPGRAVSASHRGSSASAPSPDRVCARTTHCDGSLPASRSSGARWTGMALELKASTTSIPYRPSAESPRRSRASPVTTERRSARQSRQKVKYVHDDQSPAFQSSRRSVCVAVTDQQSRLEENEAGVPDGGDTASTDYDAYISSRQPVVKTFP